MATAHTPTFTFEAELDYQDWRGRDRLANATITYKCTRDGYELIEAVTDGDESAEAELDRVVDDLIGERCQSDYDEWAADYGDYLFEQHRDRQMERGL